MKKAFHSISLVAALLIAAASVLGCGPAEPAPVVPDGQAPALVYSLLMLTVIPTTADPGDFTAPVIVDNPIGTGSATVNIVFTEDMVSNPAVIDFSGNIAYDAWSLPAQSGGTLTMDGGLDVDFLMELLSVPGVGYTSTTTYSFSGLVTFTDGEQSSDCDIDITFTSVVELDEDSQPISISMTYDGTVNGTTIHQTIDG